MLVATFTIHEAESNLVNVATNIYTQRYIGSSDKTNLIRANSYNLDSSGNQAIVAESYWINAGTFAEQLDDIRISDVSGSVLKSLYPHGRRTLASNWEMFQGS